MFEKEGKAKIEKCNHPTPEVLNSLQKVLKKEGNDKIEKNTILHIRYHKVHSSLQKVFEKEDKAKIEKCNHPTPEAYNFWQKVL